MRNQISRKITADKVVIEAECKTSYKSGSSYKAGSCHGKKSYFVKAHTLSV